VTFSWKKKLFQKTVNHHCPQKVISSRQTVNNTGHMKFFKKFTSFFGTYRNNKHGSLDIGQKKKSATKNEFHAIMTQKS